MKKIFVKHFKVTFLTEAVKVSETTKIVTEEASSLTCCHWIPVLSKGRPVTTPQQTAQCKSPG